MPDEQKLTIKQRKFIKYYLSSGNASASALKAGYKNRMSAFDTLSKPYIHNLIVQIMERQGITDKKLSQVLKAGLNAKRVVALTMEGDEEKRIEVDDIATQHKYLETALKFKGNAFERPDSAPVIHNTVSVVQNNMDGMGEDDIRSHVAGILARRHQRAMAVVEGVSETSAH